MPKELNIKLLSKRQGFIGFIFILFFILSSFSLLFYSITFRDDAVGITHPCPFSF